MQQTGHGGGPHRTIGIMRFDFSRCVSMEFTLTPELERFAEQKVKAGNYQSPSDVVRDGLQMLKNLDEEHAAFEALRNELAVGIAEADRGELEDVDDGLAERVRIAGRKRLEAWRNGNGA